MTLLTIDAAYPNQLDGAAIKDRTLDGTIGALLIGTFIGLILYGCAAHQAWHYFVSATSDGRLMQVWMFLIMLLETLHSVFCIHMCYYFLIYNRSNNDPTTARVWSQNTLGIFTGLIILLCQSFISRCIYSLWSKYGSLVIVATLLLSVGQFVAATSVTVLLYLGPGNDSTSLIRALNCVHSGLVVAANLVLTSALCYRLLTRRTGHHKTGSLIREITRYTSQGGILLSLLATLSLVFGLVLPKSQICSAIDIAATKIYTNMLLAIVNSRIQKDTTTQVDISMNNNVCYDVLHLRPYVPSPSPSHYPEGLRRNSSPVQVVITVNTEVQVKVDEGDVFGPGYSSSAHSAEGNE